MHIAHERSFIGLRKHRQRTLLHAACRTVGEREAQHFAKRHTRFARLFEPFGQDLCLSTAGRSQHKVEPFSEV